MRRCTFVAGLMLASAVPLLAQSAGWGVVGGIGLADPREGFASANSGVGISGWGLGVTWGKVTDGGLFSFRTTAGVNALYDAAYPNNDPNCPVNSPCYALTYYANFLTVGASANLAWNVIGLDHAVAPYLTAGAGWYAAGGTTRAVTDAPPPASAVAAPSLPTVGVVGYSAGIGANISRYFVEMRLSQMRGMPTPYGRRDVITVPVTVGYKF